MHKNDNFNNYNKDEWNRFMTILLLVKTVNDLYANKQRLSDTSFL